MSVPVEGTWDGPARAWPGQAPSRHQLDANAPVGPEGPAVVSVGRDEYDGGAVAVRVLPLPRWAPVLLVVVGGALVGAFVVALVTVVVSTPPPTAPVGLALLGLFALLGAAFLAAVPSTVQASRSGRRWLLTPAALVTTSVAVPWGAIESVQRQTLTWSSRLRRSHQHVLAVRLRPDVDPADLPGIAESPFASAMLVRSSTRAVALGDVRTLDIDPERLAAVVALLAGRPDLRDRLGDARGVALLSGGAPGRPAGATDASGAPPAAPID